MTTNNSVNVGLSGSTGTGNFVGSTSPSITTPKVITKINDTNGNAMLTVAPIGSAVNNVGIQNSTTGNPPVVYAVGSDTDVILEVIGQGKGGVTVQGTGTNNSASSGFVGEFVTSHVTLGSPTSFTSSQANDMTTISLTAGDWDVWGNVTTSGTTITFSAVWISLSSATTPDASLYNTVTPLATSSNLGISAPQIRLSLASTTTVYISDYVLGTGTIIGYGTLSARRVR